MWSRVLILFFVFYHFNNIICKLEQAFLKEKRPHSMQFGLTVILHLPEDFRGDEVNLISQKTTLERQWAKHRLLGWFLGNIPMSHCEFYILTIKGTISTLFHVLVFYKDNIFPKHPCFLQNPRIWTQTVTLPAWARRSVDLRVTPWCWSCTSAQRPKPSWHGRANSFAVCFIFTHQSEESGFSSPLELCT